LALLENVAIATLSLITWRVPLGNRFWSNRVFSPSKRGAKLKSDLPKSKTHGLRNEVSGRYQEVKKFGRALPYISLPSGSRAMMGYGDERCIVGILSLTTRGKLSRVFRTTETRDRRLTHAVKKGSAHLDKSTRVRYIW
jgi:hypothetical protein